ncbi:hypothetical protein FJW04_03485 [Mesorhizobium sp. B2-7-3]|nr:hypothetical protein FJW04_03485 [Mesorhizobium sp. B2-7-3]
MPRISMRGADKNAPDFSDPALAAEGGAVPPSVLPDISPSSGEIGSFADFAYVKVGDWRKPK